MKETVIWIGLLTDPIPLNYYFLLIFGVAFIVLSNAPFRRTNFTLQNKLFCCIAFLFVSAQKVSQVFEIQFQVSDLNIFVLRGVVSVLNFKVKNSFSNKNNNRGEI